MEVGACLKCDYSERGADNLKCGLLGPYPEVCPLREKRIYLKNHFRYDTLSSWNKARSYAWNIKVYRQQQGNLLEKMYTFLECEEAFEEGEEMLRDFAEKYNYKYQIGRNGRSGGYLVLYQGGMRENRPYIMPGRGMDESPEDIDKMETEELMERVYLVEDFDNTVKSYIRSYIRFCEKHTPVKDFEIERKPVIKAKLVKEGK